MGDEPGEGHPERPILVPRVWPTAGDVGDQRVLPGAPGACSALAHGLVGSRQQSGIGGGQVALAFGRWHDVEEPLPLLGEDPSEVASQPPVLGRGARHDAEQHDLGDPLGVALGIAEAKRAAPRPAQQQPAGDPEMLTQLFDVSQ
jgi:hypothetical protein